MLDTGTVLIEAVTLRNKPRHRAKRVNRSSDTILRIADSAPKSRHQGGIHQVGARHLHRAPALYLIYDSRILIEPVERCVELVDLLLCQVFVHQDHCASKRLRDPDLPVPPVSVELLFYIIVLIVSVVIQPLKSVQDAFLQVLIVIEPAVLRRICCRHSLQPGICRIQILCVGGVRSRHVFDLQVKIAPERVHMASICRDVRHILHGILSVLRHRLHTRLKILVIRNGRTVACQPLRPSAAHLCILGRQHLRVVHLHGAGRGMALIQLRRDHCRSQRFCSDHSVLIYGNSIRIGGRPRNLGQIHFL